MPTDGSAPLAARRLPRPDRIASAFVDAEDPSQRVDFGAGDLWQLVATVDGAPRARFLAPSPGPEAGPELLQDLIGPRVASARAEAWLEERLRVCLGLPRPERPPRPSCSVAVCTHRNPAAIARLLGELGALDPPADEVLVIDNDPGDHDCRALVEAAGHRYVREDRRGLNRARAAAIREAGGELVAFLDDDCTPPPGWLASVAEAFDDPTVAAATGPSLAWETVTYPQLLRDEIAGFVFGFGRRSYDWTNQSALRIGAVGAGANMVLRRSVIERLGPFAPELDAGTPTRTGGDSYLFYRLIAAGYRVVYEPAAYNFHRHPRSWPALRRTLISYGWGFSAYLTKVVVEEREPGAVAPWGWLPQMYLRALNRRLTSRSDPLQTWARGLYLLGGLCGGPAWLATAPRRRPAARYRSPSPQAFSPVPPGAAAGGEPGRAAPTTATLVVDATAGPLPEPRLRELEAAVPEGSELVVVHRRAHRIGPAPVSGSGRREVEASRSGTAAAFNAAATEAEGDVLILLPAWQRPLADFVRSHLAAHPEPGPDRIVIGYSPAGPALTATARYLALEREDRLRASRRTPALGLSDLVAENVSVPRTLIDRHGGLDERLPAGPALRAWARRALDAGAALAFCSDAIAVAELDHEPAPALAAARREAYGEGVAARRDPLLARPPERRALAGRIGMRCLGGALVRPRGAAGAVALLDGLERLRARRSWARSFRVLREALGEHERRRGAGGGSATGRVLTVNLDRDDRIRPDTLPAPRVEVAVAGRVVGAASPKRGQWDPDLPRLLAGGILSGSPGYRQKLLTDLGARIPPVAPVARYRSGTPGGSGAPLPVLGLGESAVKAGRPGPRAPGRGRRHGPRWQELAEAAIPAAPDRRVAVQLGGELPPRETLAAAARSLDPPAVAAVVVGSPEPGLPPPGLVLRDRFSHPGAYRLTGLPASLVAFDLQAYRDLGGIDADSAAGGLYAPVLDYVERALEAGYVIVYVLAPPSADERSPWIRARGVWAAWSARGALVARDGRGPRGRIAGPLWIAWRCGSSIASRLAWAVRPSHPLSLRAWPVSSVAYLWGVARGIAAFGPSRADGRRTRPVVPHILARR